MMQLNSVVLATQNINARVAFPAMKCAKRLCVHSDGSFKREEDAGCGMRGAVRVRIGKCRMTGEEVCRPLNAASPSRKQACRSRFGSEFLATCGAAEGAIAIQAERNDCDEYDENLRGGYGGLKKLP